MQRDLVRRTGLDPGRVEDVIIGCASQNAEQGANIARTATMMAGWRNMPGVSINRFCASGIDAVATAAARIRAFDLDLVAAGRGERVPGADVLRPRGRCSATGEEVLAINLLGSIRLARAALGVMRPAGYGRIILVASTGGLHGDIGLSAYATSKRRLLAFGRSLAAEGAGKAC